MPKKIAPPPSSKQDAQIVPEGYEDFLRGLKQPIRQAQIRAVLSVNRELILLYWQIGNDILQRQGRAGWGAKIIDQLSKDLHHDFPEVKGSSPRNRRTSGPAPGYRAGDWLRKSTGTACYTGSLADCRLDRRR